MTYAFSFDASACSGCKACMVACKDKNNLPAGVLWRRIYEIAGGSWTKTGNQNIGMDAWQTNVFAYYFSLACNHCIHPKCAGVCPTDAYVVRSDGIVLLDGAKCIGCGYCAWACPYSAPQYDPVLHCMTKCNLCVDEIDSGHPPACVAACPMRVLTITEEDAGILRNHGMAALWEIPGQEHPFPLPSYSRTQPNLVIRSHSAMGNELDGEISNWEEIKYPQQKLHVKLGEMPLVAFTVLSQMAAGIAIMALFSGPLSVPMLTLIAVLIGMGGFASLFHLGNPMNSWRVLTNLKKSWLSREVLALGCFMVCWLAALAFPGMGKIPLAVAGLGLIFSMAQVYMLRSVHEWKPVTTFLAFSASAILLGGTTFLVESLFTQPTGEWRSFFAQAAVGMGLITVLVLSLAQKNLGNLAASSRIVAVILAMAGLIVSALFPDFSRWAVPIVFICSLVSEFLGRWMFYASRDPQL